MAAAGAAALLSGARPPSPPHRGPWPCSDRSTWLRNRSSCGAGRSRRAATATRTAAAAAAAGSAAAADPCHFVVLGLPRSATRDQIKQAYRRLARQWHPDVNRSPGAVERFKVRHELRWVVHPAELCCLLCTPCLLSSCSQSTFVLPRSSNTFAADQPGL